MSSHRLLYLKILIVLALGSTFFLLIDDRFRGWDDSNQYQLEAQTWATGSRPPSPLISQETQGLGKTMPRYYSPLVSYVWSFVVNPHEQRQSLWRIKLLQAVLIAFTFVGFIFLLDREFSLAAVFIAVLLFFTPMCRDLVTSPISEALALFLLVLNGLFPAFSAVFTSLELMTRPVVAVLFFPTLWRQKKNPRTYFLGMATLAIGYSFFKNLMRPGYVFPSMIPSWEVARSVLSDFTQNSVFQIFDHLIPSSFPFVLIWGLLMAFAILATFLKTWRRWDIWIPSALYFCVSALWGPTGIRLLFPLVVFWFLQFFKPQKFSQLFFSRKKIGVIAALIFGILFFHSVDRQIESASEIWRDKLPETERGFVDVKSWLTQNGFQNDNLMMVRLRFCANYFQSVCFALPENSETLRDIVRSRKIHFIIFANKRWQTEDNVLQKSTLVQLEAFHFPTAEFSKDFSGITVLDVSSL